MNTRSAGESSRLAATTSSSLSATSSSANAAVAGTADPVTRSRTNFFLSIRASSVRPPRTSSRRYSLGYDPDSAYGIDAPATANEESQGLLSGVASTSGGGPHSGVGPGGRLSPSHVAITLNPEPPNWYAKLLFSLSVSCVPFRLAGLPGGFFINPPSSGLPFFTSPAHYGELVMRREAEFLITRTT